MPVQTAGTPFQRSVWNELRKIPRGAPISYGKLAEQIASPKAVRAVGLANGANPIGIVVPCHRVIGSNGSLTGYGGGWNASGGCWSMSGSTPSQVLAPERMLVRGEVYFRAPKFNSFHLKAEALFRSRFQAKFDFTPGPDHTLPRK